MGKREDDFKPLRKIWLSDGGDDPAADGPYPYAHCRLTHINGMEWSKGDDPIVGFLDSDKDGSRLIELARLKHRLEVLTLALDPERLTALLELDQQFRSDKLELTVKLQRMTRYNAAAMETAVTFIFKNPFRDEPASDTAQPTGFAPDTTQPFAPASAADVPTRAAGGRGAAGAAAKAESDVSDQESSIDLGTNQHPARLLVCAANLRHKNWQDAATLAEPIVVAVPVLASWDDPNLPLLSLKIDTSQPRRLHPVMEVTFAKKFASESQRKATALVLMENERPLVPKFLELDGGNEFGWNWAIEADREYVLYLTSQKDHFPSDPAPFNPAAPFMNGGLQLGSLEFHAWPDNATPAHCLSIRPVRALPDPKAVAVTELCNYIAVEMLHTSGVQVAQLSGDKQQQPLTFDITNDAAADVVAPTATIRSLAPDTDPAAKLFSVALADQNGEELTLGEPGKNHWAVTFDAGQASPRKNSVFIVQKILCLVRQKGGATIVPIEVTIRSRKQCTAMAIDVGASAIAVAIASTHSPGTVLLLPIGAVIDQEFQDRRDLDAGSPHFVSARVGISTAHAPARRALPWYVTRSEFDTKLRDADPRLFTAPFDSEKVYERLRASAAEFRPGRRMEIHLPALFSAREHGDGLLIVSDLKMQVCRKENQLLSDSQSIIVRDERDTRWDKASDERNLRMADVLAHAIEVLLSIYVPNAIGGGDLGVAASVLAEEDWDALYDGDDQRNFVLTLSHPASIGQVAVDRYLRAAERALLKHFGPEPLHDPVPDSMPLPLHSGTRYRTVSEALAVEAALRVARRPGPETSRDRGRQTIVVDVGAATTDVAVINYLRVGGWGEVSVSFALPIAAGFFRRWIAEDIRAAARSAMREFDILQTGNDWTRLLDQQIDYAIRHVADKDSCLRVYLEMPGDMPQLPTIDKHIDAIRFIPVDETARRPEFVALVPIAKPEIGSRGDRLLFHRSLDLLAELIFKGVRSALPSDSDVPLEIILSGRGAAAFPSLCHEIEARIKKSGPSKRTPSVFTVSDLLCPTRDRQTQLRRMKSVVAEGAALRALAIETGFVGEPLAIPRSRHVIAVGTVDNDNEPRIFTSVSRICWLDPEDPDHPHDPNEAIPRNGAQFWLARIIPGLKEKDFRPLRPDSGITASGTPENIALEIARACIIPVQRVALNGDAIRWVAKPDHLIITVDAMTVEEVRLADDGSYA